MRAPAVENGRRGRCESPTHAHGPIGAPCPPFASPLVLQSVQTRSRAVRRSTSCSWPALVRSRRHVRAGRPRRGDSAPSPTLTAESWPLRSNGRHLRKQASRSPFSKHQLFSGSLSCIRCISREPELLAAASLVLLAILQLLLLLHLRATRNSTQLQKSRKDQHNPNVASTRASAQICPSEKHNSSCTAFC